ncbi:unnamed protein product (macronuclear) [Paramecium tetraurelia]|uniref:Uncharacterized protein n=1 Tax=Paramecium tetraurelia TaxID=5888 RepID=A0DYV1_PARTE|nr:uncharacterized protein GSPATT00003186001 [Paramecium tetraurelia]CAK88218.1 unnamed protein product [Paramecium tetraurelia]|eukprot:XP_001455615.1 hypothetical protein (macronuclear) [Paramecium tetraurelia strain d4-2]
MDYKEYKQSLRYNSKNLKKIEIINIDNPNEKMIRSLTKYPLSSLEELKLETVDVADTQFKIFKEKGGLSKCFQNLIQVKLNCPSMTTLSIDYLFQGIQNIQNLDLSYTKIDNQGIYNLCQLKWPFLNTFALQWCNNIDNLDEIGENAENFPSLRNIDARFTQTENGAYNSIFNSKISVTLNHLRLYGTFVDLDTTQWKSFYLLNLFMNTMKDYKFQEFRIQNDPVCVQSSSDYKQMKINTLITTESQKMYLSISWKITPIQGLLQFLDTAENVERKFANYGKLFEFLQKQWQLRKSLQTLSICFDSILCDTNNFDIVLKTIVDFKELKKLKFYVRNQSLLNLSSYLFYFNQIGELQQLMYLQVNLQNNEILINESFLNRIIRSIQQLSYLNLFYLNIRFNEIQNIKDLHNFNSQIINSIKNPYLNHIYLMETKEENLNYRFKQALSLFHSNASKFININEFQNIILQQDPQNFKEKIFKQQTELFYKKKMKLIRSCVLSNCHQLNYGNRFRQQVIYQILDMIINS